MKTTIMFAALIALALMLVAAPLAMAEQPSDKTSDKTTEDTTEQKTRTYGQCVSEAAKIKNDCYDTVSNAYDLCKTNSEDTKQCKATYKKDKAQCKADFKSAKNECKKIKHNFFETARYAFA